MFDRLRTLFTHSAVYGLGDAATSVVSLLLLPVFTRYLSPADYGILQLLLATEAVLKTAARCGLASAFMRLYYDAGGGAAHRERLTGTVFLLQLAIAAPLTGAGLAAAPWLAQHLLNTPAHGGLLRLVLIKTFAVTFYFIPFQHLRARNRSRDFAALTFSRSAATLLLRIVFVVLLERGIAGVVAADLIVTAVFTIVLAGVAGPRIRPGFSRPLGREALRLGLPQIPNHAAQQVIAFGDRYLLALLATAPDVGVYGVGAGVGATLKLVTNAVQTAWGPFVLQTMTEPDARQVFRRITPYVFSVFVLFGLGLSAAGPDLVRLMAAEAFHPGAQVVPFVAAGAVLLGLNQLASIGLGIRKRPQLSALAAAGGAAASLCANALLIPRLGFVGAGVAYVVACAVFTGVSIGFSERCYPIPQAWTRLAHVAAAGVACYGIVAAAVPDTLPPATGIVCRGGLACISFPGVLFATGFFRRGELRRLRDAAGRAAGLRRGTHPAPAAGGSETGSGPRK